MDLSDEIENWARLANFSLTRNSEGSDTDIFWNRDGEVRYFVSDRQDGWTEVTSSDRLGPEVFTFAGASPQIVERFLFGWFGKTYRNINKLPSLATPKTADGLPNGYRLELRKFDGVERHTLVDSADRPVAVSSGGRIMAPDRLALLSVLVDANVAEIEESFRRENGNPLFKTRG